MDEHCWDYMDRSGLLHLARELGVQPNDRSRQLAGAEFQIPLETVQTLSERLGCLDEEGGSDGLAIGRLCASWPRGSAGRCQQ